MNDITRTIQADGENHTVTTVAGDTGTITLDGHLKGTLQELTDTARDDLPPAHWAHKLTADNLAVITQQELVA